MTTIKWQLHPCPSRLTQITTKLFFCASDIILLPDITIMNALIIKWWKSLKIIPPLVTSDLNWENWELPLTALTYLGLNYCINEDCSNALNTEIKLTYISIGAIMNDVDCMELWFCNAILSLTHVVGDSW